MSPAAAMLALAVVVPVVWAQVPAAQGDVSVYIVESGEARAVHIINPSQETHVLLPVPGIISDVTVQDEDGNNVAYEMGPEGEILVPARNNMAQVEYVIGDAVTKQGNIAVWEFLYIGKVLFTMPPGVDTVYANNQPVHLGEDSRFNCHGCQVILEYTTREPIWYHDVQWEEHHFVVAVRSHDNIDQIAFAQPSMSLDFEVAGGEHVTVLMPLQLLGDPYQVLLNDEKIWFHEYRNNGTHAWINFKPDSRGTATIVGSSVIPEFPLAVAVMVAAFVPVLAAAARWGRMSH